MIRSFFFLYESYQWWDLPAICSIDGKIEKAYWIVRLGRVIPSSSLYFSLFLLFYFLLKLDGSCRNFIHLSAVCPLEIKSPSQFMIKHKAKKKKKRWRKWEMLSNFHAPFLGFSHGIEAYNYEASLNCFHIIAAYLTENINKTFFFFSISHPFSTSYQSQCESVFLLLC